MAGGEASEGLGRREEGMSVGELTKSTVHVYSIEYAEHDSCAYLLHLHACAHTCAQNRMDHVPEHMGRSSNALLES